jgi:hypothetical protein
VDLSAKGLVYVVDIRNGRYILRYTGPHGNEIDNLRLLGETSTSATPYDSTKVGRRRLLTARVASRTCT